MNIMLALTSKRNRLLKERQELRLDYKQRVSEIDHELGAIEKAIEQCNEAIKDCHCPRCGGTGEARFCDAAGQMDSIECPACHGTGVNINGEARE